MNVYIAREYGANNSQPVFDAFAEGLIRSGDRLVSNSSSADVVVIWSFLFAGKMLGNRSIYLEARHTGKPVVILEVGALQRGESWKVGINGINNRATWCDPFQEDRWKTFGIFAPAWKTEGEFVTIFTQRPDSQQWIGKPDMVEWVTRTIDEIQENSKRPIVVRPHPRDHYTNFSFLKNFNEVYFDTPIQVPNSYDAYNHQYIMDRTFVAVNDCSGPSVQAAIDGTHVYCSKDSLAWDVSIQDLSTIDNPSSPDRTEWLQKLAHTEFFLEEIASGIVWKELKKKL